MDNSESSRNGDYVYKFPLHDEKISAYEATAKGRQDGKLKLTPSILSSMPKPKQMRSHPSVS